MIESHDYLLHIEGTGPKTGIMTADEDGLPALHVASPPEFGGPEAVWSPEHLFVAAVSSCLMTTFRTIADLSKLEVITYSDDPVGHLIRDESGLYRIESVTLRPQVTIADAEKVDRAIRLLEKAERACLVSRSVSAEIRMEPTVGVVEPIG
jgi:organic hydroperoxide reductase OsmC/OhrA